MPVVMVVVVLPVSNIDAGFEEVPPLVQLETLVAHAVVERFDEPVVPRFTGRDVVDPDSFVAELGDCGGDELGTVVAAQDLWDGASMFDDVADLSDEAIAGDRPVHNIEQRFAGMFIDHGGDLEPATINEGIELEVERPHLTGPGRRSYRSSCGRTDPFAATPGRHLEFLASPQPLHTFPVDLVAFVT